ncbi:MAG: sugar-binding domain-containing protein [Planctomycetota bacterium]
MLLPGLLLLPLAFCQEAMREVRSLGGLWELRPLEAGAEWRQVFVPSAWEHFLGADFDGKAEYRLRFSVPDRSPGERVFLRFAAVMTEAKVIVNGQELGGHLGGWTPFRIRIDGALQRRGLQELRVVVAEKVGHNTQGFLPVIQPHFGGIWQDVELVRVRGPAFDDESTELVQRLDEGGAELGLRIAFHAWPADQILALQLFDGSDAIVERMWRLPPRRPGDGVFAAKLALGDRVLPWSPTDPRTYRVELRILQGAGILDSLERRLAFRRVESRGRLILLNGKPLQVRGVLHWGYEPPSLSPHVAATVWRREMRHVKSLGFNMVKACLWFPPPSFFDTALEEGLLVWQEYPAWHPDFSPRHLDALLREYGEFFGLDRQRPVVVVRSLTCETGRAAADAKVVEALYERCKQLTGAALVEDDSSWISWNRFHDFYDDHPYGSAGSWAGRLRAFDDYIRKHGPKPFLLGEAVTSDTWIELERLGRLEPAAWWRPLGVEAQQRFEQTLARRLGEEAVRLLVPDSIRYGLVKRKYQLETLRRLLPGAGYVSSVMRDFRKARMGFLDDLGNAKWSHSEWDWHGELMLVLDDARAIRSVALKRRVWLPRLRLAGDPARLPGEAKLSFTLALDRWQEERGFVADSRSEFAVRARITRETELLTEPLAEVSRPSGLAHETGPLVRRLSLEAALDGGPKNSWTFYVFPSIEERRAPEGVRVASGMDVATLAWVEQGGRLLLLGGGKGGLRSQSLPFYRGAPYAPLRHPLLTQVPREMLLHLQPFDFDGGVFLDTELRAAFDTVLGFWDTHDLDHVRDHGLLLEARVGEGRILACSLGLSLDAEPGLGARSEEAAAPNPARAWLRGRLCAHLAKGPAPRALLSPGLAGKWKRALAARRVELGGLWRLEPDPEDRGLREHWESPSLADAAWKEARTGIHWEHIGLPHYDGIAWYRKTFDAPAFWREGQALHAVFEGVDDSYVLFINGKRIASFGDPVTKETVWLVRTHADIGPWLKPRGNVLALRVVDHTGMGGLHRGVWLSSTEPGAEDLVNR